MSRRKEKNSASAGQCNVKKTRKNPEDVQDSAAFEYDSPGLEDYEKKLGLQLSAANVSSIGGLQSESTSSKESIEPPDYEKKLGLRLTREDVSCVAGYHVEKTSKDSARSAMKLLEAAKDIFVPDRSQMATDSGPQLRQTPHEIQAQLLLEETLALCRESKYADALEVIDKPCVPESNLLLPRLILAECHMHLQNWGRAEDNIEAVRRILLTSGLGQEEIKKYAKESLMDFHYARAILLYRIAGDIIVPSKSPAHSLHGIYKCISKIDDATRPMTRGRRYRKIGVEYGVRFMIEMHSLLRKLEKVTCHYSSEMEAFSCSYIATNLYRGGDYVKGVEYCKIGVATLERQFGTKASKYYMYWRLLDMAGAGKYKTGEFSEAESYYQKAIKALELSTGFSSEQEKFKTMESMKLELVKTRANILEAEIDAAM